MPPPRRRHQHCGSLPPQVLVLRAFVFLVVAVVVNCYLLDLFKRLLEKKKMENIESGNANMIELPIVGKHMSQLSLHAVPLALHARTTTQPRAHKRTEDARQQTDRRRRECIIRSLGH